MIYDLKRARQRVTPPHETTRNNKLSTLNLSQDALLIDALLMTDQGQGEG